MAPTSSTEFLYRYANGTKTLVEERKTEDELYWDMGMVTGYTMVFFIFYFLFGMGKFVFQLVVGRKALKTASVKGKSLLEAVLGNKAFTDIIEEEKKNLSEDEFVREQEFTNEK